VTVTCPQCGSEAFEAAMAWESTWYPVIAVEDHFFLNPLDFDQPAFRDVEVRCLACSHVQILSDDQWEFF
jgi:ribosomal protein S27E